MSFSGFIKRTLFWTKDFFTGRKVGKHFCHIKTGMRNYKKGKVRQDKDLRMLLRHATNYSNFYKFLKESKGDVCLSDFPVVNKNILNQNYNQIAVGYQYIPEQETEKIHIQKTSGSTGAPFCIYQDSRKRYRRIAELKYFGQDVGYKSHERLAQCRVWTNWQHKTNKQVFKENIYPVNITNMNDETITALCALVKKKKIVSLRAYASWYDKIVEYLEKGKGDSRDLQTIRVAISTSEALNEATREKMLKLTGIPIIECYADEEGGLLAQQKLGGKEYYLNHTSYVFEFLKLDSDKPAEYGELARIVFTDLYNYAFPLIRYDTGDIAIVAKGNSQSNGWDYISHLYGRKLDLIYNTLGGPIHPMSFARVLKNIEGIKQWQFIQKDEKQYLIKLNLSEKTSIDYIISQIKIIVGEDAGIEVELVKEIPVLSSGKRKSVICEWRR